MDCFNIFLLGFWVVAWSRNKDFKPLKIQYPKLDLINRIFFVVPMLFPVLSILGAFLLNNHGTNILTMIMLGGIAVYVFAIVIFRKKLNPNIYPWAILMISLALLFSGWLRSWLVSGADINLEYGMFQLTKNFSFWSISNFRNAYNAMLSVTILPTIFSLFLKINDQYIFKLIIPLIFSFVPIIVYLIPKRYFDKIICFLASFFFISQPAFINWLSTPIRQEIAFLFFALMSLILFNNEINLITRKSFFLIFGFSMIVSHYSTSYIALAILVFTCILIFTYKKYEKWKLEKC